MKHIKGIGLTVTRGFLSGSVVKNPPAMQQTRVQSLGREDPLEESMATHSSILAWRIPMDRAAWQVTLHHKIPRVGHD